jgi:hypothetical protein
MEKENQSTSRYELPIEFMLTVAKCVQNGKEGINRTAAIWSRMLGADPSWPVRSPILISGSYPGKRPRWFMREGEIRRVKQSEYKRLMDEHTTTHDGSNGIPVLHVSLFDFKIRANNKFQIELYRGPLCSRQIKGHYDVEDDVLSLRLLNYVIS